MRARQLSIDDWPGYAGRWAVLHGGFDPRLASPPVRAWMWLAYGLGRLLGKAGATPNSVTLAGALLCLAVPATARAAPLVAAGLVLAAALADTVDGAVALLTRRTTRLGYVFGAVANRVGEACWLAALWLVGAPGWLVVVAGGLAWLHEYLRARATTAGVAGVTVMTLGERPTRVAAVFIGLAMSGLGGYLSTGLAVGAVTLATAIWVLLGAVGFLQLAAVVQRDLG